MTPGSRFFDFRDIFGCSLNKPHITSILEIFDAAFPGYVQIFKVSLLLEINSELLSVCVYLSNIISKTLWEVKEW